MSVPSRNPSSLLTLLEQPLVAPVVAQNTVGTAYDRREHRYHIFHLDAADANCSIIVQVSLDGSTWATLTTMTGLSVIARYSGEVLPFIRAKRADATETVFKFMSYSAHDEVFE